ncbi:MAG: hypothetical protein IPM57_05310 [Oligoflexia bacterium]|nr:hypothetical protein [Oligoflexia bacterium]
MYDQLAFEKLKHFLETNPASVTAIKNLSTKAEVGVVINDHNECVYYKSKDGKPSFERRRPQNPDLVFYLSPEAIENLVASPHQTMADVAISITKNYLAGSVRLRISGSLVNVFTRGYLNVLATGGSEYMRFLSLHGLTNAAKIKDFIIKLSRR